MIIMNLEERTNNPTEQTCACKLLFENYLRKLLSLCKLGSAIHPEVPSNLDHSEFIPINHDIKIRVLHVKPEVKIHRKPSERYSTNRNSLLEEYWFTRWNKPIKLGTCNCSFRRSQRYSKISEQFRISSFRGSKTNVNKIVESCQTKISSSLIDTPATKILNVETFVERLVQDTILEAFHEYYIKNDKREVLVKNGIENKGFINSEDEVDAVILRRPKKESAVLQINCETVSFNNMNLGKDIKAKCTHKIKSSYKPIVVLLHGIGNSAEVWWNVINCLTNRGFEVVAPDMLGHGYSSVPKKRSAYKFSKLLSYTLSVLDHYSKLDEQRKFIVIGHSFGCSLATALARYRSQQVVQLVLISGGGPTALSPPVTSNEISVFGCLQLLISPLLLCGMKRSIFYSPRGKHFKPCESDPSIPKYVLKYLSEEQNWPEGDAAFHRRILIPTLLVHGLKDTNVTLVQECEMERTIPRAFLELIPSAGHMSLLETPEQLSHMILCFLDWWS